MYKIIYSWNKYFDPDISCHIDFYNLLFILFIDLLKYELRILKYLYEFSFNHSITKLANMFVIC